jgi:hypothetical protein
MKHYIRIALIALTVCAASSLKAQWVQTDGPNEAYVNTFVRDGSDILAGTELGGIFRSTDNGRSWSLASPDLMNRRIRAIVRLGSDLFAGSLDHGVYRSSDNGATWTSVNSGLPTRDIMAMGVNGSSLFAGSNLGSKVYRSTDRGNSWTEASTGLTSEYFGATFFVTVGSDIYVGTYSDGVFRSSNNGDSWQAVNTGLPAQSRFGAVRGFVATENSLLVAMGQNVFRSTDRGATWIPSVPPVADSDGVESLAEFGGRIYAGTFTGRIYRSLDGGTSWTLLASDVAKESVWALIAGESSIVAGTRFGAFVSTDSGSTWQSGDSGLRSGFMQALAVLGPKLVAGSFGGGVSVSTTRGEQWHAASDGLTNTYVLALTTVDGKLFAGTNGGGVSRSTDSGTTWITSTSPEYLSIQALAVRDTTVFAGALNDGILRSTDWGVSWQPVNTGLNAFHVSSLAVNGAYVFAGMTEGGVYRSGDNGESWDAVLGSGWISALAVTGQTVFAGSRGGIKRSTDNGESWTTTNNGLGDWTVGSLLVNGPDIYAGTDQGVYRSTDNGDSWSALGTELGSASVAALAIQDNMLYAATRANSVWRYQLAPVASVSSPQSVDAVSILRAFPNPASASATLHFLLPRSARVSVAVYDVMGRMVANPVNDVMTDAGRHELAVDTRSLAAGVYSCSLTTGGSSVSTTLVIVR